MLPNIELRQYRDLLAGAFQSKTLIIIIFAILIHKSQFIQPIFELRYFLWPSLYIQMNRISATKCLTK